MDPCAQEEEGPSCSGRQDSDTTTEQFARAQDKQKKKAVLKEQRRLASEFVDASCSVEDALSRGIASGGAAGQLAKQRRKALREVVKACSDTSSPLEERMQLLQGRFLAAVQDQQRQDKEVLHLQAQLEAARRDAEAGRAEVGRWQQKADSLQRLARTLTADNKALLEQLQDKADSAGKVQGIVQDINAKIDSQQRETDKVQQLNHMLQRENELLKAQLQATGSVLDTLRDEQEQRLNALADQLKEQSDAMTQAQQAHTAMAALVAENKLLSLKAATADEMKVRVELLEKLVAEAQGQSEQYKAQMEEVQGTLKAAASLTETFEKMQKHTAEQQQATKQLLRERQLLQQQVVLLQQQARDQGDKMRRVQLQKQRLEGLCRTLQARVGAEAGSKDTDPGMLAAADAEAAADGGGDKGSSGERPASDQQCGGSSSSEPAVGSTAGGGAGNSSTAAAAGDSAQPASTKAAA